MAEPTLLDAILKANLARASGDVSARAALPPGTVPFVVTCMDPRLAGVLLPALGLEGVEVPQAKFAGGIVRPGDVSGTRSVLAAAIFNMASEVLVVGHTDCRMGKVSSLDLRTGLARLGVRPDSFDGQDPATWLGLFSGEGQAVRSSVDVLRADPRIPPAMPVHGLLYNIQTRRVEVVVRGYESARGSAAGASMAAPGGMRPGPVDWASPPPAIFGNPGAAPSHPAAAPPFAPLGATGGKGPVSFGSGAPLAAGPVSFGSMAPMNAGAAPPFAGGASPPPPAPPPLLAPEPPASQPQPAPSFPEAPSLQVDQQAAPEEIDLGARSPSLPGPPPPAAPGAAAPPRRPGKKRRGGSPFDRAQETLERLRRDHPR
jgi:carbonic anhydrase